MAIPMGLCVKTVREEAGLTLREAAEQIGVSAAFLYKFEEFNTSINPFTQVSKKPFCTALDDFFSCNLQNIKTPILKEYVKSILNNGSSITNLFQDNFYQSLLSFMNFSLVQKHDSTGYSYGGLFYILRDLLFFESIDSRYDLEFVLVGSINDKATSFFLTEAFKSQWGKNRTKRRKNAYKYEQTIFIHAEADGVIGYFGYIDGDYIGIILHDETFASLIFYLLLEKFSCSFFSKRNNKYEQQLWDNLNRVRNSKIFKKVETICDPAIYCLPDKLATPTYRDIFVLNTHVGKVSICCRSLVGGYHYDMFLAFGDLLNCSKNNRLIKSSSDVF